jgi:hypothetical protein
VAEVFDHFVVSVIEQLSATDESADVASTGRIAVAEC